MIFTGIPGGSSRIALLNSFNRVLSDTFRLIGFDFPRVGSPSVSKKTLSGRGVMAFSEAKA